MVTLETQPRYVSFAGDRAKYGLSCSDLASGGRAARFGVGITSGLFAYGRSLIVELNGMTLYFVRSVVALPVAGTATGLDAYTWSTVDTLRRVLEDNLYVSELFEVEDPSPEDANVDFWLVAKSVGVLDVAVRSNAAALACRIVTEDGEDAALLKNYTLQTAFEFETGGKSQWLHYWPVDGRVELGTDLLKGYFGAPSLPGRVEGYGAREQVDAVLRYRLRYYECFGEVPVAYGLHTGDWKLLLRGETVEKYALEGVPDWRDEHQGAQVGGGRLRVIGSDTRKKCEVRRNQAEYIYLFWGDESGTAESKTVTGILRQWLSDGTETETALPELSIAGNRVYRVAVGPSAVGLSGDAAVYEIALSYDGRLVWRREWEVMPSFYYEHQLLLMDRYGLMRTWMAQYVKRSVAFEADEVLNEGRRMYDVTDRVEEFTAVGAKMRTEEAQRMAQSHGSEWAYIWANGQWCRISIKPGSVTVEDEGGGMAQVTLEFVFVANKRNNIGRVEVQQRGNVVDGALMTEDGFYLMTENGEIITI